MLRLTPVVRSIIIINVVVFIAELIAPKMNFFADCLGGGMGYDERSDIITGFLSMWNTRSDCFRPYQLFTYMFVHGGIMHIFFNMLTLAFMGPMLESAMKSGTLSPIRM